MGSKTAIEIQGLEYDWLAIDTDGQVAMLCTAGGGYAPEEFLSDVDAHYDAFQAILASPPFTSAQFAPSERPNDEWSRFAERGLFVFDSDYFGGPYRLIAWPETPVNVTQLAPSVAEVATRVQLPRCTFAAMTVLTKDLLDDRQPQNPG